MPLGTAVDLFADQQQRHGILSLSDPAMNAAAVAPSDTVDLGFVTRGLYIGTAGSGNIQVTMAGTGTAIVFIGLTAGTTLPIRVSRVWNTNTTVSNLIALW